MPGSGTRCTAGEIDAFPLNAGEDMKIVIIFKSKWLWTHRPGSDWDGWRDVMVLDGFYQSVALGAMGKLGDGVGSLHLGTIFSKLAGEGGTSKKEEDEAPRIMRI